MCFTMGMSAVLATFSFAWAAYEYKQFKCFQYSIGLAYFGLMEALQVIQHIYAAGPEDDYAMCSNKVNQVLTDVGVIHIIFQPLFTCMVLMSMFRRHDITARIEADLIWNLCFFGGFWFPVYAWGCALLNREMVFLPKATEDCPNYMWLREGYDAAADYTTPNLEHKPCTYYPPTSSGHLAWTVPHPRQSYFFPGNSLHFFLMFFPYFVMFHRKFVQKAAVLLFFSGPVLAWLITPAVNEQPAIWCFNSIAQTTIFAICVRWCELYKQAVPEKIHHAGGYGEQPLTYYSSRSSEKVSLLNKNGISHIVDNGEMKET